MRPNDFSLVHALFLQVPLPTHRTTFAGSEVGGTPSPPGGERGRAKGTSTNRSAALGPGSFVAAGTSVQANRRRRLGESCRECAGFMSKWQSTTGSATQRSSVFSRCCSSVQIRLVQTASGASEPGFSWKPCDQMGDGVERRQRGPHRSSASNASDKVSRECHSCRSEPLSGHTRMVS